jgi:tRNA-modifying protein YgfZ
MTTGNNILCDLSHLGLLEISGTDAVTFLQGQVTNDVKLLATQENVSHAHYTAYCNPKGRMLALFLAFAHYDHLHLQLNRGLLEAIMKRLKMYVMRSKVEIKDVSESIIKFGINGAEAAPILESVFSKIPNVDYELVSLDNGAILKLPSANDDARFEIFTDATNASNIWDSLKIKCQLVEKLHWDWLEIHAGIPDIEMKTQEQFVPQMLNLDILNGINFKKGCYTGQEIVARTHYLGTIKRRTYLASICPASQSECGPEAGNILLDATQNEVGQLVRVAPNSENGFDVLAEMRIEAQQAGNVTWNGAALKFKDLPYSLKN